MAPELPDHIVPVRLRAGRGGETRGRERKETEAPARSPRHRVASPCALAARTAGPSRGARGPPPAPSDWWTRPPPERGGAGPRRRQVGPTPGNRTPNSQDADPGPCFPAEAKVVKWLGASGDLGSGFEFRLSHGPALPFTSSVNLG